ncbi:ATP-binding protein [[Eubacterium] cellulosolvens]
MRRIVTIGRGGTGKTSFIALLTKYLIEKNNTPLLLVDADPDQNLSEMVGVELKKTISEILYEFKEKGGSISGTSPLERLEPQIIENLHETDFFDLIAIGTKWKEGCYCLPNDLLKKILLTLSKNYQNVLIDSPAGLEHLNRRISSEVELIFEILNPSKKAFDHVIRAHRIMQEVNIKFEHLYLVGGYNFPESLKYRAENTGFEYLGKIEPDANVESYIIEGRSLLDLPSDSLSYISIKEILGKIL